jgi:hypothetical protein
VKTIEKLDAEVLFEHADLPADSFATDSQFPRGSRQAEVPRRCFESHQTFQWWQLGTQTLHDDSVTRM